MGLVQPAPVAWAMAGISVVVPYVRITVGLPSSSTSMWIARCTDGSGAELERGGVPTTPDGFVGDLVSLDQERNGLSLHVLESIQSRLEAVDVAARSLPLAAANVVH